ncbi:glycine-rich protein-like [Haliotis asinina]|uniref:glycine-rich protein-like n=1 Tax=Haliotis asinina TaxID=109174 RepID=UPI003531AFA0
MFFVRPVVTQAPGQHPFTIPSLKVCPKACGAGCVNQESVWAACRAREGPGLMIRFTSLGALGYGMGALHGGVYGGYGYGPYGGMGGLYGGKYGYGLGGLYGGYGGFYGVPGYGIGLGKGIGYY